MAAARKPMDAPSPPLEPPEVRDLLYGLTVVPLMGLLQSRCCFDPENQQTRPLPVEGKHSIQYDTHHQALRLVCPYMKHRSRRLQTPNKQRVFLRDIVSPSNVGTVTYAPFQANMLLQRDRNSMQRPNQLSSPFEVGIQLSRAGQSLIDHELSGKVQQLVADVRTLQERRHRLDGRQGPRRHLRHQFHGVGLGDLKVTGRQELAARLREGCHVELVGWWQVFWRQEPGWVERVEGYLPAFLGLDLPFCWGHGDLPVISVSL